jgi:hypothetical protein
MENEEMSVVMLRSPFSIRHSSFIDIERETETESD